ncbi:MAG: Sulfotransferase domain [Rhodobacteraceae bacterium HLUCCA12]|nr:MAG: Sulfotransferase domain [Rhodobacteraceae bacterium HLUCCA12]
MTKTLYIHIGHFKTGTTALQVFFKHNAGRLAQQGLLYPEILQFNAKHSALAYSIYRAAGVETLLHGYDLPDPPEEMWEGFLDHVGNVPEPATLISSEEFMRMGAHPQAQDILRGIVANASGIDFRIIAYLRAPRDHLRSWYNQLIKMRLPIGDFDTTLRSGMESVHLDYGAAIAPWVDIFGADRVILRPFHESLREGTALFDDFLSAIGHPMPDDAMTPASDPNPRLDDQIVEIIRLYRNAGFPKPMIRQSIERAMEYFASEEARLPADSPDFDAILRMSRQGLEALRTLPGNGLDVDRFQQELPEPEDEFSRAHTRQIGFLINEIMYLHMRLKKVVPALEKRIEALEKNQRKAAK